MGRPIIVAEVSCNHAGSLDKAKQLIAAAAQSGADAVKLQTFHPDAMVIDQGYMLVDGPWAGRNLADLYREAHTPWAWHAELFQHGRQMGIQVFSAPFDIEALKFLETLGCPSYKVASFELVDRPLIKAIAWTGKPIILSTGMASEAEIDDAVSAAWDAGARDITLLKCTSAYPATAENANLLTMAHMRERWRKYDVQVGLSDHTQGFGVAIVAASLGASMIEKHIVLEGEDTLDRRFSITPEEMRILCVEARQAAAALGEPTYGCRPEEKPQLALRRSLFFTRPMIAGACVTERDIATARPATGLAPRFMGKVIGRRLAIDVRRGTPVTWAALTQEQVT